MTELPCSEQCKTLVSRRDKDRQATLNVAFVKESRPGLTKRISGPFTFFGHDDIKFCFVSNTKYVYI